MNGLLREIFYVETKQKTKKLNVPEMAIEIPTFDWIENDSLN